jgi:hypothetical protein
MDSAHSGSYDFVLTTEERANFRRLTRHRLHTRGGALGWWPTVAALAAILAAWLWLALSGAVAPHASQIALMFGVASYFLGKWLHHWEIERAYARIAAANEAADDGRRTVVIDEAFVGAEARAIKAQYRWESFVEAEEAVGLALLWTTQFQAVVVPLRVFADAGQRAAFLAFARDKIKPPQA